MLRGSERLTDTGMHQLAAFENLTLLHISRLRITDQGLAGVGRLTNLRGRLILSGCGNLTSDGLKHLTGLSGVRQLDLDKTQINDAAVVHLKKMTNLRVLHLEETNFSPTGIVALQTALPKCAIFYTGGAIVPGWTGYTPFAAPAGARKQRRRRRR